MQSRWLDNQTQLFIDVYLQNLNSPQEYIIGNYRRLLPDWQKPPQSMILILFQSQCPLDGSNFAEEQLEKDRLLNEFYQLGHRFRSSLSK